MDEKWACNVEAQILKSVAFRQLCCQFQHYFCMLVCQLSVCGGCIRATVRGNGSIILKNKK